MTRRSFFAALLAPLVAFRFWRKPEPKWQRIPWGPTAPVKGGWYLDGESAKAHPLTYVPRGTIVPDSSFLKP